MARVRQFAKDLGINYNQAKDLINKGRSRKDGGSQILEKTMKPIKANKGKITRIRPERSGPAKVGQFKNILNMYQKGIIGEKEMKAKVKALREAKKKGGTLKMKKGGFPDLSGDGKTTMKDILIGRGVIKKGDTMNKKKRVMKRGGGMMKKPMLKRGGMAKKKRVKAMGGGMMKKRVMKRGGGMAKKKRVKKK